MPVWWVVWLPGTFLTLMGLAASGLLGEVRELPRDLGPEGVGGIAGGMFVVSVLASLQLGRVRSCPQCGAWWSRVVRVGETTFTSKDRGHFTGKGWTRESESTSRTPTDLRCRKCGHEFTRVFGGTSRRRG